MKIANVLRTIDNMKINELQDLLQSKNPAFAQYKRYISLKIEEKTIINKYLLAG